MPKKVFRQCVTSDRVRWLLGQSYYRPQKINTAWQSGSAVATKQAAWSLELKMHHRVGSQPALRCANTRLKAHPVADSAARVLRSLDPTDRFFPCRRIGRRIRCTVFLLKLNRWATVRQRAEHDRPSHSRRGRRNRRARTRCAPEVDPLRYRGFRSSLSCCQKYDTQQVIFDAKSKT